MYVIKEAPKVVKVKDEFYCDKWNVHMILCIVGNGCFKRKRYDVIVKHEVRGHKNGTLPVKANEVRSN